MTIGHLYYRQVKLHLWHYSVINGESAIIDSVSAGSINLCVSVLNNNMKESIMCKIKKMLQLSLDGTSNYRIAF